MDTETIESMQALLTNLEAEYNKEYRELDNKVSKINDLRRKIKKALSERNEYVGKYYLHNKHTYIYGIIANTQDRAELTIMGPSFDISTNTENAEVEILTASKHNELWGKTIFVYNMNELKEITKEEFFDAFDKAFASMKQGIINDIENHEKTKN